MNEVIKYLKGKKIFVAGYGFYGMWICNTLALYDLNFEAGSRRLNGWDILNPNTYTKFQKEADIIINACGRADSLFNYDVIANGPRLLLENMSDDHTFVQISSGIVGRNGKSEYTKAKSEAESYISKYNSKIVRPFATVGPLMGLDKSFAISTFINKYLNNEPLEVAPNIIRSFCYISDLVEQILQVVCFGDNKPYEIGSDDSISMIEAAKLISENTIISEKGFNQNAQDVYFADLTRIKELGVYPKHSSKEAIIKTLDYYERTHAANLRY